MKSLIFVFVTLFASSTFAMLYGMNKENVNSQSECSRRKTISGIVSQSPNFSTLLYALEEADLVGTLDQNGSFTVFAPTNAAFEKLPQGALENLLGDREALKNVLLYHVVNEKLPASQVAQRESIPMINGTEASILIQDGKVFIENAEITSFDINAMNGIVHVIDQVMLPE